MTYYLSSLPAGTLNLDADLGLINANTLRLVNDPFTNRGEVDELKLVSRDGNTVANPGESVTAVVGGTSYSGKYVGPVELSTVSVGVNLNSLMLPTGLLDISAKVNPIKAHAFHDATTNTSYLVSETPLEENNISVNLSLTLLGIPLSIDVPLSQAGNAVKAALQAEYDRLSVNPAANAISLIALGTALGLSNLTTGLGGVIKSTLDTVAITTKADPNGIPLTFDDTETCFTPGTMILTPSGEVAIETLKVGDRIWTRDHGFQPILWIGRSQLSARRLTMAPRLRPIRISAGALGNGRPSRDLTVSPQHRILISSRIVARMFDLPEILAPACQLTGLPGVDILSPDEGVTYIHLMCAHHEVVMSDGAESETLYLGPMALKALSAAALIEIDSIFPGLRSGHRPAAPLARPVPPGARLRQMARRHAAHQDIALQQGDLPRAPAMITT